LRRQPRRPTQPPARRSATPPLWPKALPDADGFVPRRRRSAAASRPRPAPSTAGGVVPRAPSRASPPLTPSRRLYAAVPATNRAAAGCARSPTQSCHAPGALAVSAKGERRISRPLLAILALIPCRANHLNSAYQNGNKNDLAKRDAFCHRGVEQSQRHAQILQESPSRRRSLPVKPGRAKNQGDNRR